MTTEPRYIQALPRTTEEVESFDDCPPIALAAERRGISQVVHFTTVSGAVGVLAARAVKSRARVSEEQYLAHVYRPNSRFRKDQAWLDYVSLSIERINDWMFQASARWHAAEDNPWVVLSFHPRILAHPGVVFTTTNNIYSTCRRAEGLDGFRAMFSDVIRNYDGLLYDRTDKPEAWPTDRQAEVLYPGELSCDDLQRIDVQMEDSLETIHGILGGLNASVPVCLAPEVFK